MSADANPTLSVVDYYKHFKSVLGAFAGLLTLLPLGDLLTSNAYLFPPLDGEAMEKFAAVATVVFSLATTFLVFFAKDTSLSKPGFGRMITLGLLVVGAVLSLGFHIASHTIFVRIVEIPAKKETITVSVGNKRNADIPPRYKLMSDEEMLRDHGVTEDTIRLLFDSNSLLVGRACLYFSYASTVILLVAFCSFGVLFDLIDKNSKKPDPKPARRRKPKA